MNREGKWTPALTFAQYRRAELIGRETISLDVIKIGTDPRNHLRIEDDLASRVHAVLEATAPSDITLVDLSTSHATLLNGQRIDKCKVRAGDHIQIGATLLVLENIDQTRERSVATPVYSMIKNGPDLDPHETEEGDISAIEITVLWGSNVLHVSHLTPPRSFCVGEEVGGRSGCDYFVPSEILGTTRAPIVVPSVAGAALVILPRARGEVDVPGETTIALSDLIVSGRARPSTEMVSSYEFDLPLGANARLQIEGSELSFCVSAVHPGKSVPVGFLATLDPRAYLYTGFSFLLHVSAAAMFAFFMPRIAAADTEHVDRDRILMMQKLLNAAGQHEEEDRPNEAATLAAPHEREGGSGRQAIGEEGSMGRPEAREASHKYGVQGPKDNPDPHLAKEAALQDAAKFGLIGLLSTMGGGDPNAPTAQWGRQDSSGRDDKSALGNMFGDTIDDSPGAGGLGLLGPGGSGGARELGIGLQRFGDLGHGGDTGPGQGLGHGRGHPNDAHHVKSPPLHEGITQVNGRLLPEIIQRTVRQNFGRFRFCYQNALRDNPSLQGRVTVKFIIDRSGSVQLAADGGSDLPDRTAVECVVRGFGNLSFPQPEGGVVTVVYPILFTPAD